MEIDIEEGTNSGRTEHVSRGVRLGYLILHRRMCWECNATGRNSDSTNGTKPCQQCLGRGFVEEDIPLEEVLGFLGVAMRATPFTNVQWVSHLENKEQGYFEEYDGVRVFAESGLTSRSAYAFIIDMRATAHASNVAARLDDVVASILNDFFPVNAANEIIWFYRNVDGGLDRLVFDQSNMGYRFHPLVEKWDGMRYNYLTLEAEVAVENRMRIMIAEAIKTADERP